MAELSGRKASKQKKHLRRMKKALRHAKARKASDYRLARIEEQIAAVSAGRRPVAHTLRDRYRSESQAAQRQARAGRTGTIGEVLDASGAK